MHLTTSPYLFALVATACTLGFACVTTPDSDLDSSDEAISVDDREHIGANEDAEFARMGDEIQKIQDELRARNGETTRRGFHAKPHRCLRGTFEVLPNLPSSVARGLFAHPKTYDAWVRFSNGVGFTQRDAHHDERGLAIKVLGVSGP